MTTMFARAEGRIAPLAGLGALALVAGALGFQYIGGLAPCEMCHWQRWAHLGAVLAGLIFTDLDKISRRTANLVMGVLLLAGVLLAWHWDMLNVWQAKALAIVILGLLGAAIWGADARRLTWIVLALVALSGLIGAYQSGMQWGFLPGPSACTGKRFILGSNMVPEIQCDVVTWSLFGLSMATYNALVSLCIAGLGAIALLKAKNVA